MMLFQGISYRTNLLPVLAYWLVHKVGLEHFLRWMPQLQSAGPATVVLTTMSKEKLDELPFFISKPITVVGEIL